jgi:hypothetical protein
MLPLTWGGTLALTLTLAASGTSCSSAGSGGKSASSVEGGGAPSDAAVDASPPPRDAPPEATAYEAPYCLPEPHPNRCVGDDSTFVFFPPLACDSSGPSDGGAPETSSFPDAADETAGDAAQAAASPGDGAAEGGKGAAGPCAGVTTLDVFFTPTACRALVAVEANGAVLGSSDPSAPTIDEPSDGDMLTPDNWSVFVWHAATRDARRGAFERALDWIEPPAFASAPLAGDAYVLEFSQGCTEILRVMLAETIWVPDPTSWAILTSLTGPVQVRVLGMRFAADALASQVVSSAPITITMQSRVTD